MGQACFAGLAAKDEKLAKSSVKPDLSAIPTDVLEVELLRRFQHAGGSSRPVSAGGLPGKKRSDVGVVDMASPLTLVIFGAAGDLARKKLFPAVYQLLYGCPDSPLLQHDTRIIAFDRMDVVMREFLEKQCVNIHGERKADYFKHITYFKGDCSSEDDFAKLNHTINKLDGGAGNRMFFLSIPPFIFNPTCQNIKKHACAPRGFTRLIIEKPFGRDTKSFEELDKATSGLFGEEQLFRIDHYLGKEVVLNLMTMRFGNQIYEPLLNCLNVAHVQLVFKEDLGTGGRGGYFDKFGIIRDIMQNHLLQVFMWLAMDPPEVLDAEHIAKRKIELLRATRTIEMKDCFLGQFTAHSWKTKNGKQRTEPGYLDDSTVPAGSICPTYAALVLNVNNERWRGVPFFMRAGKGLDERRAEIRITFKEQSYNGLVAGEANELVLQIQPHEAIYWKSMNKVPGWERCHADPVVCTMNYQDNFPCSYVADAYERVFLNAAKGDRSLFVGSGELSEAWRIFTPLLDEIDSVKPQPVLYPFGACYPEGLLKFAEDRGVNISLNWKEYLVISGKSEDDLRQVFNELDTNGDGELDAVELCALARKSHDAAPPLEVAERILSHLDGSGNGKLEFEEVLRAVAQLQSWLMPQHALDHTAWGN
eukprot:TRINITY_DN32001_c0_g1_i1.p1 TRINITY_DN32001_c0_g1~~TRINITY_DN32001_c0_g1_i1.p1  ORF type:complete len:660 (+),score=126.37 TRINITY_DN32001_c0_g1_i1:44-1981(+)